MARAGAYDPQGKPFGLLGGVDGPAPRVATVPAERAHLADAILGEAADDAVPRSELPSAPFEIVPAFHDASISANSAAYATP
jgi:hypothetical protein